MFQPPRRLAGRLRVDDREAVAAVQPLLPLHSSHLPAASEATRGAAVPQPVLQGARDGRSPAEEVAQRLQGARELHLEVPAAHREEERASGLGRSRIDQ